MPHFFAIAIYRFDDYAAASIPVLPVKKGFHVTKIQMLLYLIGFILSALALSLFGYTGYVYIGAVVLLGGVWVWLAVKGFKAENNKLWARKMFLFSLVTITLLSLVIILRV